MKLGLVTRGSAGSADRFRRTCNRSGSRRDRPRSAPAGCAPTPGSAPTPTGSVPPPALLLRPPHRLQATSRRSAARRIASIVRSIGLHPRAPGQLGVRPYVQRARRPARPNSCGWSLTPGPAKSCSVMPVVERPGGTSSSTDRPRATAPARRVYHPGSEYLPPDAPPPPRRASQAAAAAAAGPPLAATASRPHRQPYRPRRPLKRRKPPAADPKPDTTNKPKPLNLSDKKKRPGSRGARTYVRRSRVRRRPWSPCSRSPSRGCPKWQSRSAGASSPPGSRARGRHAGDRSRAPHPSPGRNRQAGRRARRRAPRCPDKGRRVGISSTWLCFSPRMVRVFSLTSIVSSGSAKPATATEMR